MLKDLIAVDGQAKDYLDKEHTLINMSKYQKLCAHLTRIRQYQVTAPAFPPDTECMTILRAAVTQNQMSDDALDELSQVCGWVVYTVCVCVHYPPSSCRQENLLYTILVAPRDVRTGCRNSQRGCRAACLSLTLARSRNTLLKWWM